MTKSKEVNNQYNFLKPFEFKNLIRLGNKNDGGYVLPEDLIKDSDGLVSFGYGYDPAFEYDYIKITKKKVFIYDYSCSTYHLTKLFLKYLKRFLTFRKKLEDVAYHFKNLKNHLIFNNNKFINYEKKKIVSKTSTDPNVFISSHSAGEIPLLKTEISVDKVFEKIDFRKAIFKCDIEGTEYFIIDDIMKYQDRIDVITIEFHWVDKNLKEFTESVKKILKHFSIVHIHGNNHNGLVENVNLPEVPEITFVNNKFINDKKYLLNFPIQGLDNPNNPTAEDLFFHFK